MGIIKKDWMDAKRRTPINKIKKYFYSYVRTSIRLCIHTRVSFFFTTLLSPYHLLLLNEMPINSPIFCISSCYLKYLVAPFSIPTFFHVRSSRGWDTQFKFPTTISQKAQKFTIQQIKSVKMCGKILQKRRNHRYPQDTR